jgi:hypothetical protein
VARNMASRSYTITIGGSTGDNKIYLPSVLPTDPSGNSGFLVSTTAVGLYCYDGQAAIVAPGGNHITCGSRG